MTTSIANGARVVLKDLLKTELNGIEGLCLGIDQVTGRYKVQINEKAILIKYENIQIIAGDKFVPRFSTKNSSWAEGLSTIDETHEWFIDCYRMRIDDDATWGGGNLHGLYDPDSTGASILLDFLIFCKLAMCNDAVPMHWNWLSCLEKCGNLLCFAFEKSDAKEKYGRENVFLAAMGGRSLRFTASIIYGSTIEEQNESDTHRYISTLLESFGKSEYDSQDESLKAVILGNPQVFLNVGGTAVWLELLEDLITQKMMSAAQGY